MFVTLYAAELQGGHQLNGYPLEDCKETTTVKGKHHSLLHPPSKLKKELSGDPIDPARNEESPHHNNEAGSSANFPATANKRQKVSLRIVPVKVKNEDGTREIETYAFIYNGSDTTLCSKHLVQDLIYQVNLANAL